MRSLHTANHIPPDTSRCSIPTKPYLIVMAAATLSAGCSQVLGFKDPRIDDTKSDPDASIDMSSATCVPANCQFGCDTSTNACRDGKLWIFKTQGAFLGNAFGGTDVPANVRGGADGKCLATYTSLYGARQCNNNRVHAVLHVSGSDSLTLMATKYTIPTNVPVNRAEDDVLVANNWNDLTDPTQQLRAPATTAATDAAGIVWTGSNTVATCLNWTSAVSTDTGIRGYTNRTDATWLSEDNFRCDRVASILCICWSGGE
ncbi:MAG TPA: hypothetical protein VHN14_37195 [Kofleriaceae bacterium]|jgi:hypothetical protein|nr:hypothetical protein [Kofleriaceae bacterium]